MDIWHRKEAWPPPPPPPPPRLYTVILSWELSTPFILCRQELITLHCFSWLKPLQQLLYPLSCSKSAKCNLLIACSVIHLFLMYRLLELCNAYPSLHNVCTDWSFGSIFTKLFQSYFHATSFIWILTLLMQNGGRKEEKKFKNTLFCFVVLLYVFVGCLGCACLFPYTQGANKEMDV